MQGISGLAEDLSASPEGLCCMELVSTFVSFEDHMYSQHTCEDTTHALKISCDNSKIKYSNR